jgi:glycosyltransferase involved in cell wall biosynthesis
MTNLVSVIVTTKNEEWCIKKCLESISLQTWKNLEIILIDNFSKDKTLQIARKFTKKIYLKGPERAAQRNFGIKNIAKGKYVIYIDADMILSPTLIEDCVKKINEDNYLGLFINELILGKSYWCNVRRFERSFYNATSIDATRFFYRKIFLKVGGFDEKLFTKGSVEDWDLDKKFKKYGKLTLLEKKSKSFYSSWKLKKYVENKGVIVKLNEPKIYHNESNFKLLPYLKKKNYYSKSFNKYINKWGANDEDIKKQFGFFYRYFLVFIEEKKWKKFIVRPDLIFGLYFLKIFIGFIFFKNKRTNY